MPFGFSTIVVLYNSMTQIVFLSPDNLLLLTNNREN